MAKPRYDNSNMWSFYTQREWLVELRITRRTLAKAYPHLFLGEEDPSLKDFVQKATCRILDGYRKWDPDYSLSSTLIHVARSMLSHQFDSHRNQFENSSFEFNEQRDSTSCLFDSTIKSPETIAIVKEDQQQASLVAKNKLEQTKSHLKKKNDLISLTIVSNVESGDVNYRDTKKLAHLANSTEKDITDGKKRIKRLGKKLT